MTQRERRGTEIFLAVMAMSISSRGNGCLSLTIGNVSGALPITHVTWNDGVRPGWWRGGAYLKKTREASLLEVMTFWIILFKAKNPPRDIFNPSVFPPFYTLGFLMILPPLFLIFPNFSSSHELLWYFLEVGLKAIWRVSNWFLTYRVSHYEDLHNFNVHRTLLQPSTRKR
jgi:hypothetical protein